MNFKLSMGLSALACAAALIPAAVAPAAAQATAAVTHEARVYDGDRPQSVELPDAGVTAPLVMADSHPEVQVVIKGRTYRFQIETGAWFNSISRKAADELGLRPDTEGQVAIDGLKLAGASFGRMRAAVLDHPPGDTDGQLGLPAFADLLLTVDFPNAQLKLAKGSLPEANGKDVLPLEAIGPLWGVPVTIGGQRFTGFVDTQSGNGIAMAPPMAQKVSFTTKMAPTGRVHGPAIGDVEVRTGRLAGELAFGTYRAEQPLVASFPVALRFPRLGVWLGPPLLKNFTVTLDQKDRLARFERSGDPVIPPPPPLVRMGLFVFHKADGSMVVAGVEPGGAAAHAGLREGDQIVAIEGTAAETITPVAERAYFTSAKPIKVRVRHRGAEREVEVSPTVFVP
jgi:hypothetical protein